MSDWQEFVLVLVAIVLLVWCIAALPIGRATMRSELLKDGYRVVDVNTEERLDLRSGEGKWIIEIWRDGWVRVER